MSVFEPLNGAIGNWAPDTLRNSLTSSREPIRDAQDAKEVSYMTPFFLLGRHPIVRVRCEGWVSNRKLTRNCSRTTEASGAWYRLLRHALVLFVADLFHPVDNLSVELFLNGDVSHGRCW